MNEIQESIRDYLQVQRWDSFFTATFTPLEEDYTRMSTGQRMLLRPAVRYSHTAIDKVINTLCEPRLRPTKLFVAAEQHYLGGWHCHGLMEYPRRESGEVFHDDDMLGFQRNNLSKLGYNKVDIVNDMNACSVYLSKYLVKDDWHGDWKMTGRPKFWQGE